MSLMFAHTSFHFRGFHRDTYIVEAEVFIWVKKTPKYDKIMPLALKHI